MLKSIASPDDDWGPSKAEDRIGTIYDRSSEMEDQEHMFGASNGGYNADGVDTHNGYKPDPTLTPEYDATKL